MKSKMKSKKSITGMSMLIALLLGVFVFLSLWRYFKKEFLKPYFLPAWFLAIILLMITAYHGGLLVFHFGVGYLK